MDVTSSTSRDGGRPPEGKSIVSALRRLMRSLPFPRGNLVTARLDEKLSNKERGMLGERLAETFLTRRKKFRILVRNWRKGRDEIDLVCLDSDTLVFVEVKTRGGGGLVPGYFAVDRRKKEALLRVCRAYIKELRKKPKTFRFDVVEVVLWPEKPPEIHHFEVVRLFPKDLRFTR